MKTLAVLVFTFLCMASAADLETSTFKVTQDGKLPNWLIQNVYDGTYLRVRVDTLQETSTRKFDWQSKAAVTLFDTVNMTKDGKEVVVECITYKCVPCAVTDGKETFGFNGSVDVFLFNEGGKYVFLERTFDVQPGSFKFNFEINDWKFASEKNKLTQTVTVQEEKTKLQYSRILKEEQYGTFITNYPDQATVDGKLTTIKLSTSSKGGAQKFDFPYFKDSIYYDPTVYTRNTDPVPAGYTELETHTMRVFYKPEYPDLYLLDQEKDVQGYLHVSVTDMNETNNVQYTDWSKQEYTTRLSVETLLCKGKDKQTVQTLVYTCFACQTNLKNPYVGQVKFYLINESMSQCKFGGAVGYQVDVKSGDVKMDLSLVKYTWVEAKNTLKLTILTEEGGVSKLSALGASRENADLKEFSASFAQEVVVFNTTDPSDNKPTDTKVESSNSHNIVDLQNFDAEHGVYYDPVFHRGSSASLLSFLLFALFFLL